MTRVLRSGQRYRTVQDGIESWHCFAAGGHFDEHNVSFGALIGCDEHLVAPGAGFDWHGHRGVDIVSWVLSGQLHHEDDRGSVIRVGPGPALVQSTGSGVRHRELNACTGEPLHLVQSTVLGGDAPPSAVLSESPVTVSGGRFVVWRAGAGAQAERWHVFVGHGTWRLDGGRLDGGRLGDEHGGDEHGGDEVALDVGDSVRGEGPLSAAGSGSLLVWLL